MRPSCAAIDADELRHLVAETHTLCLHRDIVSLQKTQLFSGRDLAQGFISGVSLSLSLSEHDLWYVIMILTFPFFIPVPVCVNLSSISSQNIHPFQKTVPEDGN